MLTADAPLAYRVTDLPQGIEVAFLQPVTLTSSAPPASDGILSSLALTADRRLVLETGPGYRRREVFELRNPWRLVIDLGGTRTSGSVLPGPAEVAGAVLVIDPGHGGVETGAIGAGGLKEKDVTLDLARRLKGALAREPGLTVVLTREDDRVVGLDARTAIANHNKAELFLSIHLNSAKRRDATGAETYFLASDASDDEARTLAAAENRDARGGGELELILWDLAQNTYLSESSRLAETVQRELNALAGTRDRGVRQAPFRVLMGATMPAILVEVGFVSNPAEEAKLKEDEHRDRIVQALVRAVQDFRGNVARLSGSAEAAIAR
jgi:N-acetylmuramoyl-L-alanine amidase